MNACEDQSEPLGENLLAAIDHQDRLGMLQGADTAMAVRQLAERQTQALTAVRALHKRRVWTATMQYYCDYCLETGQRTWPCDTIRAIDKAGA